MSVVSEGPNNRITLDDGVVLLRVWRNAEMSYEEGAEQAEKVRAALEGVAGERGVAGLVFDAREAPTVAGPRTRESIGHFFAAFAAHHKHIAIIVRADAVMRMQMERLVDDHTFGRGGVFDGEGEAARFVREGAG